MTNLFIDSEHPGFDVAVVIVRDVVYSEDGSVLLGVSSLWPEGRILLLSRQRHDLL